MAQFAMPKPIADRLLSHVDSIKDGKNPDIVVCLCIVRGIDLIKRNGIPPNLVPIVEAVHANTENKSVTYKEVDAISVGPTFNDMKIKYDLRTRRHLVREAIFAYCVDVGIIDANGKLCPVKVS